jgi:mono/diheme cytochrome c family protein
LGRRARRAALFTTLPATAAVLAACGTQGISIPKASPYYSGAVLFRDHCSGCHTLAVVGAEGSATSTVDRLRNQGPNFNVRKETVSTVMYAIENGGFSGAIMPQNILVGHWAMDVAQFLAKYSGLQAKPAISVPQTPGAN